MNEPKVMGKSKIQLSDEVDITVCFLDDGRGIIPEPDMLKVLKFLGFNESEINRILTDKINKI